MSRHTPAADPEAVARAEFLADPADERTADRGRAHERHRPQGHDPAPDLLAEVLLQERVQRGGQGEVEEPDEEDHEHEDAQHRLQDERASGPGHHGITPSRIRMGTVAVSTGPSAMPGATPNSTRQAATPSSNAVPNGASTTASTARNGIFVWSGARRI